MCNNVGSECGGAVVRRVHNSTQLNSLLHASQCVILYKYNLPIRKVVWTTLSQHAFRRFSSITCARIAERYHLQLLLLQGHQVLTSVVVCLKCEVTSNVPKRPPLA